MNRKKLLAHGRWFSPGTPASSTTKTEILLKVALNTKNQKSIMNRKMQNKMKMIYFRSVKKKSVFCKDRGGAPKNIMSTRTCETV